MSLISELEVQLGITGLKGVLDALQKTSRAAGDTAKDVSDAADREARATERAANRMRDARREMARGLAAGSGLEGLLDSFKPGRVIEGIFGTIGKGLGGGAGLLGNLGGLLGGGGLLGLPANLLGGLSKGIAGLSGLLAMIPVVGPVLGALGGVGSVLVGGAGAIAGAVGGLVRGLGSAAASAVGHLFSFGAAILKNPLVSGVLTGGISLVVTHFGELAKIAGAVGIGLVGLVGGLMKFGEPAKDFQKQISNIAAVSGATPEQRQELGGLALRLGADPTLSGIGASDAAKAIEELIKAGVKLDDIFKGGARGALLLASAGETDVAEASALAANALNVFGLSGDQLVHVADLIAGAANASSISVTDFGFSLQASGAMAAGAGQDFDDLAVAIAIMGNAGIKGQDAGTSLKTFLSNLVPTTKAQTAAMRDLGLITASGQNVFLDAKGNFKDLDQIAGLLQRSLKGLSESQRQAALEAIFGSDAVRAAIILADAGADGFAGMAAAMGKVTAAGVGAVRMDNLAGDLEQLGAAWETLRIRFGTAFLPMQREAAQAAAGFVNAITPGVEAAATWVAGRLTALSGWLRGWATRLAPIGRVAADSLLTAFRSGDFNRAFGPILSAIGAVFGSAGMGGAALPLSRLLRVLQLTRDAALTFAQALREDWGGQLTASINPFVRLAGILGNYWGGMGRSFGDLFTGRIDFSTFLGQLTNNLVGPSGLLATLGANLTMIGPGLRDAVGGLGKWLVGVGKDWWEKYLKPDLLGDGKENGGLLGGFFQWLGTQGPALVDAIGGFFDRNGPAIGAKINGFMAFLLQRRPTAGQAVLGEGLMTSGVGAGGVGQLQGQKGFLDYWDDVMTAVGDLLSNKIGPLMDRMWQGLKAWWGANDQQIKDFFANALGGAIGFVFEKSDSFLAAHQKEIDSFGKAIADAIGAAIAAAAPAWFRKWVIGMPEENTGNGPQGVFEGTTFDKAYPEDVLTNPKKKPHEPMTGQYYWVWNGERWIAYGNDGKPLPGQKGSAGPSAPGGAAPGGARTMSLRAGEGDGGGAMRSLGGGIAELHVHVNGVTPAAIAQEIYDALAPLLGPTSAGVSM